MENIIPFRLRAGKDDDIKQALEAAITEEEDRSEIIRKALRAYLLGPKPETVIRPMIQRTFEPIDIEPITLKKIEKSDEEIEGDIDNLLGDF
jgi:hypothetical protein